MPCILLYLAYEFSSTMSSLFSFLAQNSIAAISIFILAVMIIGAIIFILIKALWNSMHANEALKYEFVTIIAHKFRTPLTTVKWMTDELAKGETDPYKKESLKAIQESNEKLISLTGTLIETTDTSDASKMSYAMEPVDLCSFVRSVADTFKNSFHEKNLFFSVRCGPEGVAALIDRQRMEFVLGAVFENARTYSPPGNDVDVMVGLQGNSAVITVVDHGIGIERNDLSHVFSKFFRADNARLVDTEGFGVGLYLAQSVIRRFKGSMEVYSEGLKRGTTCVISLPAVAYAPESVQEVAQAAVPSPTSQTLQ